MFKAPINTFENKGSNDTSFSSITSESIHIDTVIKDQKESTRLLIEDDKISVIISNCPIKYCFCKLIMDIPLNDVQNLLKDNIDTQSSDSVLFSLHNQIIKIVGSKIDKLNEHYDTDNNFNNETENEKFNTDNNTRVGTFDMDICSRLYVYDSFTHLEYELN